jgi:hypothetical protein
MSGLERVLRTHIAIDQPFATDNMPLDEDVHLKTASAADSITMRAIGQL